MSKDKALTSKKEELLSPFPICCAGDRLCQHPQGMDQRMTSECDHCDKDCHDMCGDVRDVPHKLLENFPGFYCFKCIERLPKRLYPRIPPNGIPVNVPDNNSHGYAFQVYMNKMRAKFPGKSKSKKKKSFPTDNYASKKRAAPSKIDTMVNTGTKKTKDE